MIKAWRVIKSYLPLILEVLKDFDLKALEQAEDKKAEFKRQVREFFAD